MDKKKRKAKRIQHAKHRRNGFAMCINGAGKVNRCGVCLGRTGLTHNAVKLYKIKPAIGRRARRQLLNTRLQQLQSSNLLI